MSQGKAGKKVGDDAGSRIKAVTSADLSRLTRRADELGFMIRLRTDLGTADPDGFSLLAVSDNAMPSRYPGTLAWPCLVIFKAAGVSLPKVGSLEVALDDWDGLADAQLLARFLGSVRNADAT